MSLVLSNLDTVIFASPLVWLLFAHFFRADILAGRPIRQRLQRREMPGADRNGVPLCLDPDQIPPRIDL